jgi:hypothetical protein
MLQSLSAIRNHGAPPLDKAAGVIDRPASPRQSRHRQFPERLPRLSDLATNVARYRGIRLILELGPACSLQEPGSIATNQAAIVSKISS